MAAPEQAPGLFSRLSNNPLAMNLILNGMGLLGSKYKAGADRYMGRISSSLTNEANRKFRSKNLLDAEQRQIDKENRAKALEDERAAQYRSLLGTPAGETADPVRGEKIFQSGTGLRGGDLSPHEFAAETAAIPGYESVGGSLMNQLISSQATAGNRGFDEGLKTKKLILDYQKQAKPVVDTLRGMQQNFDALVASASTSSEKGAGRGAADLAMVFSFAKMLDPASVVREGEQQMITRSDGVFGYLKGLVNNVSGKGALDAGARQGLVAEAYRHLQEKSKPLTTHLQWLGGTFGEHAPQAIPPSAMNFQEYVQGVQLPTSYGGPSTPAPALLQKPEVVVDTPPGFDPNDRSTWPPPPGGWN